MAVYEVPYQPGELMAVGYTATGKTEPYILHTAGNTGKLQAVVQKEGVLSFITVDLADEDNNRNLWDKKTICVEIEGTGELMGFGSANPSCEGSYKAGQCMTYDGRVMAVIRRENRGGSITVTFHTDDGLYTSVEIPD